jgi:Uma2 family endonuclease
MVALPKARMTAEEYLRWSQSQDGGRHELVGGEVVMMSPETVRHVHVKSEAWLALRNAIKRAGVPCQAFADGVSVRIDKHMVREPDISVQCKPADPDALALDAPVIVAEVVSPTSVRSDTGAKVGEYFSIPTLRHYLIIDPFNMFVIRHSRSESTTVIETEVCRSGSLVLDPPGITVAVDELLGPAINQEYESNA